MGPDSPPPPPEGPRVVRLRVRTLERVDGEAVRTASSAVFCPGQCRSMGVDTCLECPRLTTVEQDAIHCCPPPGAVAAVGAPVGSDAHVGEAMGFATFVVDACLPATAFARSLGGPGHRIAVVVDGALQAMGLVEVAVAAMALEDCSVEDLVRRVSPIYEGALLAQAVDRMVHERARALPVVDQQGRVVGLLTDLDALHWVASRSRP